MPCRPAFRSEFARMALLCLAGGCVASAALQLACAEEARLPLGRGINLGNMLEAPQEGAWGRRVEDQYARVIKQAGFDTVRVPVRWSSHAAETAPYRIDPEFVARVRHVVDGLLAEGLNVVLNVHHYEELYEQPDEHRERFLELWRQIAAEFADAPPALVLELLNEPHADLDAAQWNALLVEALAVVRQRHPTRTVMIGPANWNAVAALPELELPAADRHILVTFHYYLPFHFTHQGASWAGDEAQQWLGTKWTGSDAERAAAARDFDAALQWAKEHDRPLYLGEFGAYERADMESRARWTRFVVEAAWQRGMGYAYWEFASGFGAYDADAGRWREPLRDALVPPRPTP